MKCLLDTHTLLWLLFEDEKLSERAKDTIKNPDNEIFISVVSYWEISLKYALGKLEINGITPEELPQKAKETGIETLEISEEEASSFYKLPKIKHKDPFDRLIIWQAINRKITLISKDKPIKEYQKFGLDILWK
jgi:PIN domain nuclease of toxin-antitoxin system